MGSKFLLWGIARQGRETGRYLLLLLLLSSSFHFAAQIYCQSALKWKNNQFIQEGAKSEVISSSCFQRSLIFLCLDSLSFPQ